MYTKFWTDILKETDLITDEKIILKCILEKQGVKFFYQSQLDHCRLPWRYFMNNVMNLRVLQK
jgi:hypothetical protein